MGAELLVSARLAQVWKGVSADANDTVRARFLRGAVWSVIGSVVNQGAAFVAGLLAARMLGNQGYGELTMVQSSVTTWATVAVLGMNLTATRFMAECAGDPRRSGRIIGLAYTVAGVCGLACAGLLLFGSDWVSAQVLGEPSLAPSLRVGGLLMLVTVLDAVQAGGLAGLQAFRALAWTRLAYGIAIVPLTAMGVWLAGVPGAVVALTGAGVIRVIGSGWALLGACRARDIRVDLRGGLGEADVIWRVSLPSALGGILVGVATWLSQVVFAQQPGGYPDLGVFNAAMQWRIAILFLPTALGNVLLPMVTEQREGGSRRFRVFNQLMAWALVSVTALPLMAFPELVQWLYGARFSTDGFSQTMALTMVTAVVLGYGDGLGRVLTSRDMLWWGAASNLTWGVLLVGATRLLRHLGPQGLAWAYVVAYLFVTILFLPLYWVRDLVPRDLLFSWDALATWVLAGCVAALTYLGVSPLWRGIVLAVALAWWAWRVWRLLDLQQLWPEAVSS